MKFSLSKIPTKWIGITIAVLVVAIGFLTRDKWFPMLQQSVTETIAVFKGEAPEADKDDAAKSGKEQTSLKLSPQARRNIGLTDNLIRPIHPTTFWKSLTIPGTVVERHGKTHLAITSPMTGIVTGIYVVQGEAVAGPAQTAREKTDEQFPVLFKIRLTHEDLVKTQTTFLQTLGELKVVEQEITRLKKLNPELVPIKLRDRIYEEQKLQVIINAQSEGLLLHGLSAAQVKSILTSGKLIREVLVRLPSINPDGSLRHHSTDLQPVPRPNGIFPVQAVKDVPARQDMLTSPMIVDELNVKKGQLVQAGQTLCILSDYTELFVEGQAFEYDTKEIEQAAKEGWHVTVLSAQRTGDYGRKSDSEQPKTIVALDTLDAAFGAVAFAVSRTPVLNFENRIDLTTRALHFYVRLRNRVVNERTAEDGHRYIDWRFKPGQRMQLRVPVAEWKDRFVLPVEAVTQEGAEFFIFQQSGDHFNRKPVHVEYQDQFNVVIANDGSIFPGDVIAHAGAHQMQMALKNKAGGGVDAHAGHNH